MMIMHKYSLVLNSKENWVTASITKTMKTYLYSPY